MLYFRYVSLCLDVGQHHFSQGDEGNALRLWRQSKSSTEKQLLAIVSRSATKANLPVFDRVIEMIEDKKLTPDAKLGETLIQCLCKHQSMTRLQIVLQLLRKHNISLSPVTSMKIIQLSTNIMQKPKRLAKNK